MNMNMMMMKRCSLRAPSQGARGPRGGHSRHVSWRSSQEKRSRSSRSSLKCLAMNMNVRGYPVLGTNTMNPAPAPAPAPEDIVVSSGLDKVNVNINATDEITRQARMLGEEASGHVTELWKIAEPQLGAAAYQVRMGAEQASGRVNELWKIAEPQLADTSQKIATAASDFTSDPRVQQGYAKAQELAAQTLASGYERAAETAQDVATKLENTDWEAVAATAVERADQAAKYVAATPQYAAVVAQADVVANQAREQVDLQVASVMSSDVVARATDSAANVQAVYDREVAILKENEQLMTAMSVGGKYAALTANAAWQGFEYVLAWSQLTLEDLYAANGIDPQFALPTICVVGALVVREQVNSFGKTE
mmetsp:Transcript_1090/g.2647  ORF Transcript_1090/g.2647 Transcript_1090/m.2647 type:complete len:366 (-) Transcript_1090:56-1153(-)